MLILILLFFTSLILYYHFFHKLKRYPRGPTPIPLIGNTLTLKKYGGDIDKILIEWRRKFGDIYTIWIGETPLLMVNGYNKIMELFHNDDGRFSGRFKFGAKDDLLRGGKIAGVLHTENQLWQETRRFILRVFRDFGLGKDIMQERVLNEVSDLIAIINRDIEGGTKEHAMCEQIEARVGSVINSLLFGYRFDESKMHEFQTVKRLMSEYVKLAGSIELRIAQSNHLFIHIPKIRKQVEKIQNCAGQLIEFFANQIREHEKNCDFSNNEMPQDFVEAYLRKQHDEPSPIFTHHQLIHVIYDLWLAGQETTSTVLSWLLIYLIKSPKIQKSMQEEMDRVVGDKLITMADRSELPFTCAVVNEGLRLANILTVNVFHKLLIETEIDGYLIPKNTCVIPQIGTLLYDETVFKNPYKFDPSRFLDENGKLKSYREFLPFSEGKRQCLGESIAKTELFLFTSNIFNQFEIFAGEIEPSSQRNMGGTIYPIPFKCQLKKRYNN